MVTNSPLPIPREIIRKLIHLSALWMPVAVYLLDKWTVTGIFAAGLAIAFIYEKIRCMENAPARFVNNILNPILRENELGKNPPWTGATYVMLAAFVVTLVFPADVAIAALCIMLLSDTAAALIGTRYGKVKIAGNKTLEGSIAFFITAFITTIVINAFTHSGSHFMTAGLFAAGATTLVELITDRIRINDNLGITLTAALVLWIFLQI